MVESDGDNIESGIVVLFGNVGYVLGACFPGSAVLPGGGFRVGGVLFCASCQDRNGAEQHQAGEEHGDQVR